VVVIGCVLVDADRLADVELVDVSGTFDPLRFEMAPMNVATTRPTTIAKPICPATGQPRERRQNFVNLPVMLRRPNTL
jgi:hypothetical protein